MHTASKKYTNLGTRNFDCLLFAEFCIAGTELVTVLATIDTTAAPHAPHLGKFTVDLCPLLHS
jgi:hypothetical protein